MDSPHPHHTPRSLPQRKTVRISTMSMLICFHKDPKHDDTDSWYNADEEQNFKLDARDEMASYLHGTVTCIPFGMEHLQSRKYAQKQAMMKRLVQFVVLSEQTRHIPHEHPYDKQDRIAIASMKRSKWSRVQARAIGIHQMSQQDMSAEE
eukprot:77285_1